MFEQTDKDMIRIWEGIGYLLSHEEDALYPGRRSKGPTKLSLHLEFMKQIVQREQQLFRKFFLSEQSASRGN